MIAEPPRKRRRQARGEARERTRIVAAFMGLLVEQSINKIDMGQIGATGDVSLAQLRAELRSTIAVLAAHVERIDRRAVAAENAGMAERDQSLAMLLSTVLRAWLEGGGPDLTRAASALDRASAWLAPPRLPRPGLPAG
jgi:hypothetical protein